MKISELPLTTSVDGSEILPIVQGGTTKKVSITDALAGAGGGGTNPTDNYIPYNNAGTFADSYLKQDGNNLTTYYSGNAKGISLDFNTNYYYFGDLSISNVALIAPNIFEVGLDNGAGSYNVVLNINTSTQEYSFGNQDTQSNIYIAESSKQLICQVLSHYILQYYDYGGDDYLRLASTNSSLTFLNSLISFIPSATSNTRLFLGSLGGNEILSLQDADGVEYGININKSSGYMYLGDWNTINCNIEINTIDNYIAFNTSQFLVYTGTSGFISQGSISKLGDFDGNNNGTYWGIDDDQKCILASNQLLVGTSGSASGQHLKINVGGTEYVIELKNP